MQWLFFTVTQLTNGDFNTYIKTVIEFKRPLFHKTAKLQQGVFNLLSWENPCGMRLFFLSFFASHS